MPKLNKDAMMYCIRSCGPRCARRHAGGCHHSVTGVHPLHLMTIHAPPHQGPQYHGELCAARCNIKHTHILQGMLNLVYFTLPWTSVNVVVSMLG